MLITLILGAFLFAGTPTTKADDQHQAKQTAKVDFDQQYRLGGALLFGEYLVVHDDESKAHGEDCMFFYRVKSDGTKALGTSYHGKAVIRAKAAKFTVIRRNCGEPICRHNRRASRALARILTLVICRLLRTPKKLAKEV